MGCPVYLAVHLRNLPVLHTLLKASVKSVSLTCLTSLDVNGETALHSAVKSKAAGLARLYSKLLTFNGSTVTSAPLHHMLYKDTSIQAPSVPPAAIAKLQWCHSIKILICSKLAPS